eukprot:TRINITY_DN1170_c0_g1_i1.p1 TRINITY_DN1170_c0_g1~~TRINITY_DN1170_c0_g1_i1.p1  ORF type:complete len:695 (-),score=183.84 TRINITY_DN1170_c0_g1_i1:40-2091(-)
MEWLSDYIESIFKSPTWVIPIAQFVDERCVVFDSADENKLEYTVCHDEFKTLIDDLFLAHLLDVSVPPEEFEQFCEQGLASSGTLHRILAEQLLSVDDFLTFKAMMVKRNADLDLKAALLVNNESGDAVAQEAVPAVEPGGEVVGLVHSSGDVGFVQWPLVEGGLAWHDEEYCYEGVPEEMLNTTLFAGPHSLPIGTITLHAAMAVTVYIFYENSGPNRNGGIKSWLRDRPEWVHLGGTMMKWACDGGGFWMSVFTRKVAPGGCFELPIETLWVGGVAFKLDSGEWRLYEEQEQELKTPAADRGEQMDDEFKKALLISQQSNEVQDAKARCEEAELEQALALSMQAEEERMRLVEQGAASSEPAACEAAKQPEATSSAEQGAASSEPAACEAATQPEEATASAVAAPPPEPETHAEEVEAAPAAAPAAPPPPPPPKPDPSPAVASEAPPPAPPAAEPETKVESAEAEVVSATPPPPPCPPAPAGTWGVPSECTGAEKPAADPTPEEAGPSIPRMVKLKPLVAPTKGGAAPGSLPSQSALLEQIRAEKKRDLIDRASAKAPAAPPDEQPQKPAAPPTDEERLARAEYLKRQRDILMQKRTAERDAQLKAYQQSRAAGGTYSAVDRAMEVAFSGGGSAGATLSSALSSEARSAEGAAQQQDTASQMRQALTLQLRQTLLPASPGA